MSILTGAIDEEVKDVAEGTVGATMKVVLFDDDSGLMSDLIDENLYGLSSVLVDVIMDFLLAMSFAW